jgi:hypothetical protein
MAHKIVPLCQLLELKSNEKWMESFVGQRLCFFFFLFDATITKQLTIDYYCTWHWPFVDSANRAQDEVVQFFPASFRG